LGDAILSEDLWLRFELADDALDLAGDANAMGKAIHGRETSGGADAFSGG
jgi:hypothetical protein